MNSHSSIRVLSRARTKLNEISYTDSQGRPMGIPIAQMFAVARHVLKQRIAGRERYPFVLMLEPLFRCNLSCTGCGKVQYPASLLRKHLSVDECVAASDECDAPMVSIAGGEPLLHPQIG